MINFNNFELNKFSKFLETISDYTNDKLRYPKAGELVEKALAEFSNNQLERVNRIGVDLITPEGATYESKICQFTNKSKMDVRGIILKNRHSSAGKHNDILADYFIITDVKKGKACCIPSSKFFNLKDNGAKLTASANPELKDFFLTGFNLLEEREKPRDYFKESDEFDLKFIRSI